MTWAQETSLAGVRILTPEVHADHRGFLVESYRAADLVEAGIADEFVQDNHSRSVRGALRGLHFQAPPGQAKLVRVARGSIYDVVVDIRRASPTFGQHLGVTLDDVDHRQLYIPTGLAHGFLVTSDEADVVYRLSRYYEANLERGIAWDDPALGIRWPDPNPTLSDRDRANPTLAELPADLTDW